MKKILYLLILVLLISFFLVACNGASIKHNEDNAELQDNNASSNNEAVANMLTEDIKRKIYKAIVAAEDKAQLEADKIFPSLDNIDDISKNQDKYYELASKYKKEVREKFDITEETQQEIIIEGLTNDWPMD